MVHDEFDQLEEVLGYRFNDRRLLVQALTHSSRKNELQCSNERLEFFGDAILGVTVSEYLYRSFPDYTEGDLTRVKSVAVSRDALVEVARTLGLEKYLIVAKGVARATGHKRHSRAEADSRAAESAETGRAKRGEGELPASLLSDALEALIAAVYLDGGFQAARDFVTRHMHKQIEVACKTAHVKNFKSILQRLVQRKMGTVPTYRVTAEEGPDHVKWFEVASVINGKEYGSGHGGTKKAAEQRAAERTLAMMGQRRILEDDLPAPP